jgi:pantothenate kinase type III
LTVAFDVGNGSVKYARFEAGRRSDAGRLALDADFGRFRGAEDPVAVSVNPPALERLRAAVPRLRVAGADFPAPIAVHYDPPSACGLDRVMAVVGALHRRADASSVVVLDAGTCLTVTVGVRGEGVVGGSILPGPDLWSRALALGTAGLPLVRPEATSRAVGRSTEESIRAGIAIGFPGAAREVLRRTLLEFPGAFVVATGTGGGALACAIPEISDVHPFAVLWGVYLSSRP